jgi:hypothetical protein
MSQRPVYCSRCGRPKRSGELVLGHVCEDAPMTDRADATPTVPDVPEAAVEAAQAALYEAGKRQSSWLRIPDSSVRAALAAAQPYLVAQAVKDAERGMRAWLDQHALDLVTRASQELAAERDAALAKLDDLRAEIERAERGEGIFVDSGHSEWKVVEVGRLRAVLDGEAEGETTT